MPPQFVQESTNPYHLASSGEPVPDGSNHPPEADRYPTSDFDGAQPQAVGKKQTGIIREIVETALIAVLIFVGVRSLVLNFKVDGSSMVPSLVNGEMLLVNKNAYESFDLYSLVDWLPGVDHAGAKEIQPFDGPNRGDVVVFDPPVTSSKPYIKRIIGLPGETIEIRNGRVFVDGIMLEEPYLDGNETDCGPRSCEPVTVPEGHVYVLGDNRSNSSDSRFFGTVEISSILGKAWITYWPVDHIGKVPTSDYGQIDQSD
jgi:signal peptidase I